MNARHAKPSASWWYDAENRPTLRGRLTLVVIILGLAALAVFTR